MMRVYVLMYCGCLVASLNSNVQGQNAGVLDKIKTGLKYASNYLETAREIADLVSGSLGTQNQKRGDEHDDRQSNFGTGGLVTAFFRLLGLDPHKISAIAVNSAIFFAQMISSMFNLKPLVEQSRSMDDDSVTQDPMQLIFDNKNERVQKLVRQAQDAELPAQLIDRMEDGLDTSCIQHLICKASPIIWAAQRSLTTSAGNSKQAITSWLPTKDEFEENGHKCEERYTACEIFPANSDR